MNSNIKDVAKLANVSISTVSRVTNNAPNVQPHTKTVVLDAINKLNYKPNKIAQTLGGGAFHAIGIVATRSSHNAFGNPYFSTMIQAIGEVAEDKIYDLMLNNSSNEDKELEKCINMIESKVVRGLILLSSRINDRIVDKLTDMNFPFVLVGRVLDIPKNHNVYTVDTDNFNDCREAVNYLIQLGHKKIGCIHAPLKYVVSKDRLDGYIEAHKDARMPVDYSLIQDGGYTVSDAHNATIKILKLTDAPTAIFATDDIKAFGVYKAIQELGLKIPDDISVIGHNNYDISTLTSPSLTTIDVPIFKLGTISAEILFDLIEGKSPEKTTILDTKFIVRESCKSL